MLLHVLHVPTPSPSEGTPPEWGLSERREAGLAVGKENLLCPGWVTLVHVGLGGLGFASPTPFSLL